MLLLKIVLVILLIVIPVSEHWTRSMLAPLCAVFVHELVFVHFDKRGELGKFSVDACEEFLNEGQGFIGGLATNISRGRDSGT